MNTVVTAPQTINKPPTIRRVVTLISMAPNAAVQRPRAAV
jgi:hypothetical protein